MIFIKTICLRPSNDHLDDIKKELTNTLDKSIVLMSSFMVMLPSTMYIASEHTKGLNEAGEQLLSIGKDIGYWVCIIMCIYEMVKNLIQGDTKDTARILIKYSIAYASLFIIQRILDFIRYNF